MYFLSCPVFSLTEDTLNLMLKFRPLCLPFVSFCMGISTLYLSKESVVISKSL